MTKPIPLLTTGSQDHLLTNADVLDISKPEKTPFYYKIVDAADGATQYAYEGGFETEPEARMAGVEKVDEILRRFE